MSFTDIWLFLQQGAVGTGDGQRVRAAGRRRRHRIQDRAEFRPGRDLHGRGYIALFLTLVLGWPYLVVIPVTLLAVAVAALFQRVVMERVIASKGVGVQLVIATLGLAYALKGLVRQSGLGDTPRSPPLAPTDAIIIGDAVLTQLDLVIFAVAVAVMLLLFCMFRYTASAAPCAPSA